MNDMPELSRLIDEAMTKKNIGINALSRAADKAGLPLSASTISLYRRGSLPKSIPSKTLEAFSQLLGIPRNDLYEAAYGGQVSAEDQQERASLEESINRLPERQQKLVRQLIHELARNENTRNAPPTIEPQAQRGKFYAVNTDAEFNDIAARNWRDGDPDLDDDNLLGDA